MAEDERSVPVTAGSGRRAGAGSVRFGRRVVISLGNALAFSVRGGPPAAAGGRQDLREHLGPKLDPEIVEHAELLLSELINNCVLHRRAARPDVWIDVTASMLSPSVWIEVCDGGPTFQHEPRKPSPASESGRGLYLVEQLLSRWGISDRGPARVWFELARA